MTESALDRARREADDLCRCREQAAHSGACGEFLCPCYCSHHQEHRSFKMRTANTVMDQPCRWPGHAAIARLEAAARLAGRIEQAEKSVAWYVAAESMIGMGQVLRDERDRLRREAEKP